MKEIFKFFTKAIYPALISLFIFAYTTANTYNIVKDTREPIQITCIIMCIAFLIAFVTGVAGYIVSSVKNPGD